MTCHLQTPGPVKSDWDSVRVSINLVGLWWESNSVSKWLAVSQHHFQLPQQEGSRMKRRSNTKKHRSNKSNYSANQVNYDACSSICTPEKSDAS